VSGYNDGTRPSTLGVQQWVYPNWVTFNPSTLAVYEWVSWSWYTGSKQYYQAYQTATGGDADLQIAAYDPVVYEPSFNPDNAYIDVSVAGFVNDTQVDGQMMGCSQNFSMNVSGGVGNFSGSLGNTCGPWAPRTYTETIRVQGMQSGQVVTGTVTFTVP
jgi:hypothetical protein